MMRNRGSRTLKFPLCWKYTFDLDWSRITLNIKLEFFKRIGKAGSEEKEWANPNTHGPDRSLL